MMLAIAAFALAPAAPDCAAFFARIVEPVALTATPLSGSALGARPAPRTSPDRPPYSLGPFIYRGNGIELRSRDPRFAQIHIAGDSGPQHPCGAAVDAPSGWNGRDTDLAKATLRFRMLRVPPEPSPGFHSAAKAGAVPVLPGYQAGASWPVGYGRRRYFIGLMHPIGRRWETLVVAFPDRRGRSPAKLLARVKLRLVTLSVLPDLHRSWSHLNFEGESPAGGWVRLHLEMDDATEKRIGDSLGR